ncbi:MAG: hypothetical protein ABIL20_06685, partial [candidate division WOR-3 bacterium]
MEIRLRHLDNTYTIQLEKGDNFYNLFINGKTYKVSDINNLANTLQFKLNNESFNIFIAEEKD